ncbi:hypothetical protein C824_001606 [Schaedlerella arabinosiphila]|nr:hypothetical protein C824_001606 [Schaedlerella arabinosiphila]
MVGISYGSYSSAAGQLKHQAANSSKKKQQERYLWDKCVS